MRHSVDYHDYVFKNGKKVYRFNDMYKYSKTIPWHQDKTVYAVFSDIDIAILQQFKYRTICEIGCGLGYFSGRLYRELESPGKKIPQVTGIDISAEAVNKAKKSFPNLNFVAADILNGTNLKNEYFDLVIAKELLWYVFSELNPFLRNAGQLVKNNGFFYFSQSFPESKKWLGQDVVDSPKKLIRILSKLFRPIHYCIENDFNYNGRPLVHFLGRVNK